MCQASRHLHSISRDGHCFLLMSIFFSMRDCWLMVNTYILRKSSNLYHSIPDDRDASQGLGSPAPLSSIRGHSSTSLPSSSILVFCCYFVVVVVVACHFVILYLQFLLVHPNINLNPNSVFRDSLSLHRCLLLMNSPPRQVVQPLWMSGTGDGLRVFEHTEDMFDKDLIQRKLYDAWQIGLVLAEAMNMESFYWITPLRAKKVRNAR